MKQTASSASRFFQTLVVMGSGLTLGCSGTVQDTPEGDAGAGSGGAGSGAATNTGGVVSTGGGASTGGTAASGGVFDCPLAQWDCSSAPRHCDSSLERWPLPTDCSCDPQKPATPEDCAEGEKLVCHTGVVLAEPEAGQSVTFDCVCIPSTDGGCYRDCYDAFGNEYGSGLGPLCEPADDRTDCGCALILLK